jgi:lipoprotein NlpI
MKMMLGVVKRTKTVCIAQRWSAMYRVGVSSSLAADPKFKKGYSFMKVYILKTGEGEYDSYCESVDGVYLVEDSTPSITQLEDEWSEFIKEERKKAKAISKKFTQGYMKSNGLFFQDWFEKKYPGTKINFEERIS